MALAQAQSSPVATSSVAEVFSAEQFTPVAQADTSEQAAAPILAPTPTPSPKVSKSPLSGSLALMTDYRFRGISQTWRGAALQGGVEMALPHGLYVGTWLSNVSTNSYPQGQSLEHDIYGGWRGEVAPDWQLDTGLLHYRYPGARLGTAQGGTERFDTTEAYVGATLGGFSAKWSIALTPYFGLRDSTAGSAFASALTPAGSSRGSQYLDWNYQQALGDWATLGVHAGYTHVRNYSDVSYADWRVSLAKTWGIWTASAAWLGTSADAHYYSAMNSQGRMRSLGRSGWVFGLSAAF
ncbi:TorF family putative porin [Comamonas sp. Y33R10-2]|nr:TorF family putative porin [Comamonas sp. Y33R10-2]